MPWLSLSASEWQVAASTCRHACDFSDKVAKKQTASSPFVFPLVPNAKPRFERRVQSAHHPLVLRAIVAEVAAQLMQAQACYREGNRLLTPGNFRRAVGCYGKALCSVVGLALPGEDFEASCLANMMGRTDEGYQVPSMLIEDIKDV
jgi:hypothetical protein